MPTDKTNMPGQNVPRMKTVKPKGNTTPYPMPTYQPGTGPNLPIRKTTPMPSYNLGPATPRQPGEPVVGINPPKPPYPNKPNTPDAHVGANPKAKLTPPRRRLGPPQVLYGPEGPPGLNKPPGSRRAIGKGLSGPKAKALMAEMAKKKLNKRMKKGM